MSIFILYFKGEFKAHEPINTSHSVLSNHHTFIPFMSASAISSSPPLFTHLLLSPWCSTALLLLFRLIHWDLGHREVLKNESWCRTLHHFLGATQTNRFARDGSTAHCWSRSTAAAQTALICHIDLWVETRREGGGAPMTSPEVTPRFDPRRPGEM